MKKFIYLAFAVLALLVSSCSKDDNEGSRHQKFLVKIDNYPNITVLIAHNIDLAPRIEGIQANNPIRFYPPLP